MFAIAESNLTRHTRRSLGKGASHGRRQNPLRSVENNLSPRTPRAAGCCKAEGGLTPDTTGMNIHGNNNTTPDKALAIRIRDEPFSEHYTVEAEIGRGKFAVVKRCRHNTSGFQYAAKCLRKRRKGKDCRHEILQEVVMLQTALPHPRLVDLVEVFETSHEIIVVTEYAAGGELFQHIVMEDRFEEKDVVRLMRQILEGLVFLHTKNIVHLDVKPHNILLTRPLPSGDIKLCDFGFARKINCGEDMRDIIGTPDYVAPEVLDYEPLHTACDMWSVGVLTYVMLTGCSPFAADTKQETFCNISQVNVDYPEDLFEDISTHAIDFISKLLVKDPSKRMTSQECLHHQWLKQGESTNNHLLASPIGSPIGCRRALSPPSPGGSSEEPTKKCKCDQSETSTESRDPALTNHGAAIDAKDNSSLAIDDSRTCEITLEMEPLLANAMTVETVEVVEVLEEPLVRKQTSEIITNCNQEVATASASASATSNQMPQSEKVACS